MKKLFYVLFLSLFCINTLNAQSQKTALQSLISASNTLHNNAKEGTTSGQYAVGSKAVFNQVIQQAQTVYSNSSSSNDAFESATETLFKAYNAFLKQRYGMVNPGYSDTYDNVVNSPNNWAHYNTHDPSIIYAEGYWYSFSTGVSVGNYNNEKGIPVKRSRDLVNWEARGWTFRGLPSYISNDVARAIGTNKTYFIELWAPYIQKVGSKYRLYFSATFGSLPGNDTAIVLVESDNIEGPWTYKGVVVYTLDSSTRFNAIDPTVVVGKDGKYWMYYGSWHNGIARIELNPTTGLAKAGASPSVTSRNRVNTNWVNAGIGWTCSMEAPEVIYNETLNKYFMFLAQGDLFTVYHTRVARADKPEGPWYDYFGNNINYTTGKDIYPIIQHPYKFNSHQGWTGIAHSAAIFDGEDYFLVNQARPMEKTEMMVMHARKIYWTEDGWPVVSPERYANPGIMRDITINDIVGSWERIVFNEVMSGSIASDVPGYTPLISPNTLTLNAGGTTNTSGSWSFSGNTLSLTENGSTIKLIIDWEWDWENKRPTIIFTGINKSGKGVWGKKIGEIGDGTGGNGGNGEEGADENIILNGTFDDGYKHWIDWNNGGSFVKNASNSGINGNTLHIKCSANAPNYWDQQTSWLFPASKASQYRLTFKTKASTYMDIWVEIQPDGNPDAPILRESFQVTPELKTHTFTTSVVGAASTGYLLNFLYGNMIYNSELWIDDIVLEDIGTGWYSNFITNGKFTDNLNCWISKVSGGASISLDNNVKIDENKTVKLQLSNQLSTWDQAGISWPAYLYSNRPYYYEFDAISNTGMDLKLSLLQNGNVVSECESQYIEGEVAPYRFILPEITEDAVYTVALNFGKAQKNSAAWISNVKLVPCNDGNCQDINTEILSVSEKQSVSVYPNPTDNYLFVSAQENIKDVAIYDMNGRLLKKEVILSSECMVDISNLSSGCYVMVICTNNTITRQIITKR